MQDKAYRIVDAGQKRIQTTMIGALDKFEKNFGYLWGHYKEGELTEQEEKFADLWDFTRNQILNQGNTQMRHFNEDIIKALRLIEINQKFSMTLKPDTNKD